MSETAWLKSSFSTAEGEQCLEVNVGEDGMIYIRESDHPDIVAVTTPAKWDAFVKGVKAGEFDHFAEIDGQDEPNRA